MDVNRDNFATVYPEFHKLLETCKFVAFDEELTGVFTSDVTQKEKKDDTVQLRYQKMAAVATKYSIISFGVCLFHDDEDGESLVATPNNFYLFSTKGDDMVLSTPTNEFLARNNMDFGQWLSKGIHFVDADGEARAQQIYYSHGQSVAVAEPELTAKSFEKSLGFRRVFNDLVACKKPMVGHNLLIDLLFMMRWLDADLPSNIADFRTRLHDMMPSIYDTKFIASLDPLCGIGANATTLEMCYATYARD